jgi:hypothetical protein
MNYAIRVKFKLQDDEIEDDYGFYCGTGLSALLIRPYEEFQWNFDDIYDIIDQSYYYYLKDKEVNRDSVVVIFFLPVYAISSGKPQPVYSNPLSINYSELIKVIKKKNEDFLQGIPSLQ